MSEFNYKKTRVSINAYPKWMIPAQLMFWLLDRFPKENIFIKNVPAPFLVGRNVIFEEEAIQNFTEYENFVFIDNEMRPNKLTDTFFLPKTDIVGCCYPLKDEDTYKKAWFHPETFHTGFWRIKATAIERLIENKSVDRPWFNFLYNDDMTSLQGCDCNWFLKFALECSLSSSHAGFCEHDNSSRWHAST